MHSLILLNGGVGTRVGANQPKQFLKVHGIPILVYSLTAVDEIDEIGEIVMNYPAGWKPAVEAIIRDYAIKTPVTLVEAGATRHESVAALLRHCSFDGVIIHEAARPLVLRDDFDKLIATPGDNVALLHEIPFTVAPVEPATRAIVGSLERARLRNVQLPQKFSRAALTAAHERAAAEGVVFTEDATLVATSGFAVTYIDGRDENFKVTTPTDIRLASFLMRENETSYE